MEGGVNRIGEREGGSRERRTLTFNRIRLCQLAAILQQFLGQRVPGPLLLLPPGRVRVQAQVDVRGGEVVGVELVGFRRGRYLDNSTRSLLSLSSFLRFLLCVGVGWRYKGGNVPCR